MKAFNLSSLAIGLACLATSCGEFVPAPSDSETSDAPERAAFDTDDAPLPAIDAEVIKTRYANNRNLYGKLEKDVYEEIADRLTLRFDAHGNLTSVTIPENRSLHSMFVPIADINALLAEDPFVTGIRIYPGLDTAGVKIIDKDAKQHWHSYTYSTIVFQGTVSDGSDGHNNLAQEYQYIFPCPKACKGIGSRFVP